MFHMKDAGPVRRLILDNPATKNAIGPEGWSELAEIFRSFESSTQRVLIVSGAGGDFCSGADLTAAGGSTGPMGRYRAMKAVDEAALELHRLTKPTIAAVDGVAVGAGMNLALGCDLVIGSDRCRFAEIFVRRGLTVDFGGTWHLPRLVGMQRAKELALTGRIVEAPEARRIGLVLETVSADHLDARVGELAEVLAAQAPLGQMFAKRALNSAMEKTLSEALAFEAQAQALCLNSADAIEGFTAFVEKRTPEFQGR